MTKRTERMRVRYVTINPDGTETVRDFPDKPDSGNPDVLRYMRGQVGGFLEHVRVRYNGRLRSAYINEEGKLKRLPFNRRASEMYCFNQGLNPQAWTDAIVGPLVIEVPL